MKRLLSLFLAIAAVLTLSLPAFAAADSAFTDINGHWAASYIITVTQDGLMNGTSDTVFSPDKNITRGMFVTVLGRFAGINPEAWSMDYDGVLFPDVNDASYYAPYVNWAARSGIALGSGGLFQPDSLITREQMLTMIKRYADAAGKTFVSDQVADKTAFSDEGMISPWAKDAVTALLSCGIIQGISNGDGSMRFSPKVSATRAQAAAIFCRMVDSVTDKADWSETFPTLLMLSDTVLTLTAGESVTLTTQFFPTDVTNTTITWISSNPAVAKVAGGKITWVSAGYATIYAYTANGCKVNCDVLCEKKANQAASKDEAQFIPTDTSLAYASEPYTQKCERIFGSYVSDPRAVYGSASQARVDIVTLHIPAWDIGSDGQKYTRYFYLDVHKNIASTVEQIFKEIYACPAKYPIHSIGGYRYEARSEHNCGLAIDINPNENYYCSPGGQALVGSFFSPQTSEYSFAVAGEVDQIFSKYGFTRGIYWNSGYKDYMHYSFFGT